MSWFEAYQLQAKKSNLMHTLMIQFWVSQKGLKVARAIASRENSSLQSISIAESCVYLHNETLLKEIR